MELAGDEKRIQALFSELTLEDQRLAPPFEKVLWRAAPERRYIANRSIALIGSALISVLVLSLILWSRSRIDQQIDQGVVGAIPIDGPSTPKILKQTASAPLPGRRIHKLTVRKKPTATDPLIAGAVAISSWQSPTASIMASSARHVFKSAPQLNQHVTELQSFLPHSQIEELNQ
jgi:hypothetical protein